VRKVGETCSPRLTRFRIEIKYDNLLSRCPGYVVPAWITDARAFDVAWSVVDDPDKVVKVEILDMGFVHVRRVRAGAGTLIPIILSDVDGEHDVDEHDVAPRHVDRGAVSARPALEPSAVQSAVHDGVFH